MANFSLLYERTDTPCVVIAHRGASALHPENTMSAFREAIHLNADMIELDVSLSNDQIPVVIHDHTLERTTNGSGSVHAHTLDELKALDAGSWFDKSHKGEAIPTLEEVLQLCRDKVALNIEFKPLQAGELPEIVVVDRVIALVKEYGMENHVMFSSFDYRILEKLRKMDVDIYIALLYEKNQAQNRSPIELVQHYGANAFNCSKREYTKSWAEELRVHEIPVFVYTIDKLRKMEKVWKRGAAGIFSNKPEVLRGLVDNLWKTN